MQKLYKSGKMWIAALLAVTAFGLATTMTHQSVSADSNGLLYAIGDSTTAGWNPYNDGSQSYDVYAAQDLQVAIDTSSAISGTALSTNDLFNMTDNALANPRLAEADNIVIGMGVNDINYGTNNPMNVAIDHYRSNLIRLHNANPKAKISVLLPVGNYLNGKNNDTPGTGGYSLNDLRVGITQMANSLGVNVIDTNVVTDANHNQTIPDGVHPTNETYKAIGAQIANALRNNQTTWHEAEATNVLANYAGQSGYLYSPDVSTANGGYNWFENGQLFTGFRYYAGTYYWFVNGVRQNEGWRHAWGLTYWTDIDGRAVQGQHVIDGKVHDFGNDGTYYDRPVTGYLWDGSPANGGWRWYENSELFTGFRYHAGTYYWFIDGVRQNEGWRHAWGLTYWTDGDGRAVQGHHNIDGHDYYFGNDGTYYLR